MNVEKKVQNRCQIMGSKNYWKEVSWCILHLHKNSKDPLKDNSSSSESIGLVSVQASAGIKTNLMLFLLHTL